MIEQFLPANWQLLAHGKRAYAHSHMVAYVAQKIASNTAELDTDRAYEYGLMHDIGKFYLSKSELYKHPRIGYELLVNSYPDIATICLTHPFPDFNNYEHILHYHHEDENEAKKVFELLGKIEKNIYIELIQFCDKISRMNDYIRWEDKLQWYLETYNLDPNEISNQYSKHLKKIKQKLDTLTNMDVYNLIGI